MSDNKDNDNSLDNRIREARNKMLGEVVDDVKELEAKLSPDEERSARAGSEFLSTIIAGALLGFGLDWFFETTPLATIFFIVMAFVSAVYRANATMNKNDEKKDK